MSIIKLFGHMPSKKPTFQRLS